MRYPSFQNAPRQRLEPLRRHQPLAVMSVDEPRRLDLHQLGEEPPVGEELDVVVEPEPVCLELA